MTPFVYCARIDQERAKKSRREFFDQCMGNKQLAERTVGKPDPTPKEIGDALDRIMAEESKWPFFRNDIYQVQVRHAEQLDPSFPPMLWLTIRRIDREPIHDWREFQEIKNALVGPEHEGIELYPAESRLVDTANQYHLFVFKDPTIRLPVGFQTRAVSSEATSTYKQRPRT